MNSDSFELEEINAIDRYYDARDDVEKHHDMCPMNPDNVDITHNFNTTFCCCRVLHRADLRARAEDEYDDIRKYGSD